LLSCREKNLDKLDRPVLGNASYILRCDLFNARIRQRERWPFSRNARFEEKAETFLTSLIRVIGRKK
jgi:hypothetical protein